MRTALTLAAWLAIPAFALADGDEKVKFDDLPPAVRKAVQAKYPEAKIDGASREKDDDGEMTYEVELTVDGQAVDVVLDAKGEIEAIERTIPFDDLPRAVIKAARIQFANDTIAKVEEITDEDDVVIYELTVRAKDKSREVLMSPNGKILDLGDEDDDDDEKGKDKDGEKEGKKDKDDEKPKG